MADELLVFRDDALVRRVPLGPGRLLVGRGPEVDLALAGRGVSRRHVWIAPDPGGWRYEDAGSTNGVRVNGRPSPAGRLREGDRLEVGEHRLVFLPGPPDRTAAADVEALFLATSRIRSCPDHRALLEAMLDHAVRVFEAARGLILLPAAAAGDFEIAISRGIDPAGAAAAASQTVAREAAAARRPIALANSHLAGDFLGAPSIEAREARSILCAPLVSEADRVLGVVYLDGEAAARLYGERDRALLSTFAMHVAAALDAQEARQAAADRADRLDRLRRVSDRDAGREAGGLVTASPAMARLGEQLDAVAARDTTVFIMGESGTGKELVARALHERSPRRAGPFVPVNCMALVSELAAAELFGHERGAFTGADQARPGRFELADGGTLFLDEIGELSPEMQVRLLRVLQERCFERVGGRESVAVDVRVVAATNRDMKAAIAAGRFREDLWYRLNVFTLALPPLRERPEDVPALTAHFVAHFSRAFGRPLAGPGPELMARLARYPWPGNVRELRNVIERAFVLERGPRISAASLPGELLADTAGAGPTTPGAGPGGAAAAGIGDFHAAKSAFERDFFARALRRHGGNMTAAAAEVGVPRKTIYRKLKALGTSVEELLVEGGLAG